MSSTAPKPWLGWGKIHIIGTIPKKLLNIREMRLQHIQHMRAMEGERKRENDTYVSYSHTPNLPNLTLAAKRFMATSRMVEIPWWGYLVRCRGKCPPTQLNELDMSLDNVMRQMFFLNANRSQHNWGGIYSIHCIH